MVVVEAKNQNGRQAEGDCEEPGYTVVELHGPGAFVRAIVEVQEAAETEFHGSLKDKANAPIPAQEALDFVVPSSLARVNPSGYKANYHND